MVGGKTNKQKYLFKGVASKCEIKPRLESPIHECAESNSNGHLNSHRNLILESSEIKWRHGLIRDLVSGQQTVDLFVLNQRGKEGSEKW